MANAEGIAEISSAKAEISDALDTYGSTLIITPRTDSTTIDIYGQPIFTASSTTTTVGVLFNNSQFRALFNSSAVLQSVETQIIVKGDEVIKKNDYISFQSKNYKIIDYELYNVANINIAISLRVGLV